MAKDTDDLLVLLKSGGRFFTPASPGASNMIDGTKALTFDRLFYGLNFATSINFLISAGDANGTGSNRNGLWLFMRNSQLSSWQCRHDGST